MFVHRSAGLTLVAIFAIVFALPAQAAAVSYHVTTTADSGPASLRAAITAGNNLPASQYPDIKIYLDSSDPILLTSPLPVITKPVFVLSGANQTRAVIDGQQQFRILQVNASSSPVITLEHVSLNNGQTSSSGGCVLLENQDGIYGFTSVEFYHCRVKHLAGGAHGGAIWMEGGTLTVRESEFRSNRVTGKVVSGGAISLWQQNALLTVENSVFKGNVAYSTDATSGNSHGGAIRVGLAKLAIRDNVFRENYAVDLTGNAGTRSDYAGGAIYSEGGRGTLERNFFNDNHAADGGGLFLNGGLGGDPANGYEVTNNTFVGNYARVRGGALHSKAVDVVLRNNSFFANTSDDESSILALESAAHALVSNNLFAAEPGGSWCAVSSSTLFNESRNIVPTAACRFSASSDYVTTDLVLQGYPVGTTFLTRSPLVFFADSPALDGGYISTPTDDVSLACPTVDGLGNPRNVDGDLDGFATCDVGAFEWQREASLFADDFEDRIQPSQP